MTCGAYPKFMRYVPCTASARAMRPVLNLGLRCARSWRQLTCCTPRHVWYFHPIQQPSDRIGSSGLSVLSTTTTSIWFPPIYRRQKFEGALIQNLLYPMTGSQPVPTLGAQSEFVMEPARVNRKRLREMFATGVAQLEPVFTSILSESTLSELQRIASLEVSEFNYPADLWAKTVFEFAASYHKSVISRDHIVQALVPLYRGRTLTFLLENRDGSGEDIERNSESLCADFERLKPYLLEVWADRK